MQRYIGTYRVDVERDVDGNPMEFTFIRGSGNLKGCHIYRETDTKLSLYSPAGAELMRKMAMLGIQAKPIIICSKEYIFEFDEPEIDIYCKLIKVRTKGKNIDPRSVLNDKRMQKKNRETDCVDK